MAGVLYDGKPRSVSAVEILTRDPDSGIETPIYVYYCRFDIKAESQDVADILGVYSALGGTPPAVVSASVGRGRAIGVHLETSEQDYEDVLPGHEDMLDHIHVCHRLAETSEARMRSSH